MMSDEQAIVLANMLAGYVEDSIEEINIPVEEVLVLTIDEVIKDIIDASPKMAHSATSPKGVVGFNDFIVDHYDLALDES